MEDKIILHVKLESMHQTRFLFQTLFLLIYNNKCFYIKMYVYCRFVCSPDKITHSSWRPGSIAQHNSASMNLSKTKTSMSSKEPKLKIYQVSRSYEVSSESGGSKLPLPPAIPIDCKQPLNNLCLRQHVPNIIA